MRNRLLVALMLAGCGSSCPAGSTTPAASGSLRDPNHAPETIHVTIGGLDGEGRFQNAQVFSGFGCTGENRSPALTWTAGPQGTQSYALIMHDPDAPTGVGFFHWIVTDIPADTLSLPEGGPLPEAAHQNYTDFGGNAYGGPCPPPGAPHHYEITIYAIDAPSLGVPAGATGALVRFMAGQHTVALGRAGATWQRAAQ